MNKENSFILGPDGNPINHQNVIVDISEGKARLPVGQSSYIPENSKFTFISKLFYLQKLGNIIMDHLGWFKFEGDEVYLKRLIQTNPHNAAMSMLGFVAEAVIVQRCHDNENINHTFFSLARDIKGTRHTTSQKYVAYGTGLKSTEIKSLHDTKSKLDIVWADSENRVATLKAGRSQNSPLAGLQIKTSWNGRNNIYNDMVSERYDVPIIYFDLANDFRNIRASLRNRSVDVDDKLISVKDLDMDIWLEVRHYYELLYELAQGKLAPKDFISATRIDNILKTGMLGTIYDSENTSPIIIP